MRILEILAYPPDDAPEFGNDADAEIMDQLANAFTRRGVVKALVGSGMRSTLPPPSPEPAIRRTPMVVDSGIDGEFPESQSREL